MSEFSETVELETQQCYSCGIIFAVPKKFLKNRKEDSATFYCPNYHALTYPKKDDNGETSKDKLIRLEEENSSLKTKNIQLMSQLDQVEAQLAEVQPADDAEADNQDGGIA